ncbi:unnamed protein product (macronuclear) [Paramecium tetraurelia]|uniref:DEK C-terminal domain-containing protein n=1 Tax=Paramecium tetraurelia TaxID=5888 RepID=A0CDC0_PARTE|nr:uncharacterized protein GSPATT00006998001 [Paramecium tetraurelia]CAK68787.1 unnamed protein product [Paramecium tetraurelia]|eukprot:XP_001436184.1 hypothetical protein (macronuclear) [Paramecium tetraurelia strain d4-2]
MKTNSEIKSIYDIVKGLNFSNKQALALKKEVLQQLEQKFRKTIEFRIKSQSMHAIHSIHTGSVSTQRHRQLSFKITRQKPQMLFRNSSLVSLLKKPNNM